MKTTDCSVRDSRLKMFILCAVLILITQSTLPAGGIEVSTGGCQQCCIPDVAKYGTCLKKCWIQCHGHDDSDTSQNNCESTEFSNVTTLGNNIPIACNSSWKNCADVYKSGHTQSGIYRVKPGLSPNPVDVYCDNSTGGGWTVIQRRIDGQLPFNRTWDEYKQGFGDLQTEFWLANDIISYMTAETESTLRIDLMDFNGETRYAQYTNFTVLPENQNYKLQIGQYSGTAGEANGFGLSWNNGMSFSTIDRDNDLSSSIHCAAREGGGGGWWYTDCGLVNLNGYTRDYITGRELYVPLYILWWPWKGFEQLKPQTEMKFRPSNI